MTEQNPKTVWQPRNTGIARGDQVKLRRPAGLSDWSWTKHAEEVCGALNSMELSLAASLTLLEEILVRKGAERAAQPDDTWLPWSGQGRDGPVRLAAKLVHVRYRDGQERCVRSDNVRWRWEDNKYPKNNVTHWRLA